MECFPSAQMQATAQLLELPPGGMGETEARRLKNKSDKH